MASRVERRLAAILCADLVGYSRLIERDEAGTLCALRSLRREVVDRLLSSHGGRIVQVAGDGALVEFGSVVDAVQCAAAVQQAVAAHQAVAPPECRLVFRIGINLGDVVAEGADILGDGVNVAARLEQLCEPGGVLVSETVREHVGNRLGIAFEDLGPRTLKNIDRPVRVHRLVLSDQQPRSVVVGSWPARVERPRPSLAVLLFENLSRDPDQDYFGEGLAEDLITDLTKISGLQVAGRRTTFAARQVSRDPVEAGARLQVGHVLEGSIRRARERIRITARLVDGATGAQVWAERYDRLLDDIFAVQDDITHQIVAALQVNILPVQRAALARPPTINIEAYGDYLRGLELLARHEKRPSTAPARWRSWVSTSELWPGPSARSQFSPTITRRSIMSPAPIPSWDCTTRRRSARASDAWSLRSSNCLDAAEWVPGATAPASEMRGPAAPARSSRVTRRIDFAFANKRLRRQSVLGGRSHAPSAARRARE